MVDLQGRLIGLNTRRLGRGFYLAQATDKAFADLVASIRSGERPQPRRLGLGLVPAAVAKRLRRSLGLDPVEGLLVRFVEEDSPAAAAGVQEGDVLVRVAGMALSDVDQLHSALASAGDQLELDLVRVNDEVRVTARFS